MTFDREIPEDNLPRLTEDVAELNKRAVKLGLTPMTVEVVSRRTEETTDEMTGVKYERRFATVRLTGESPKLAGWNLVARITPVTEEAGALNLVKCVPGVECPAEFRDVKLTRCDHCNSRRYRKDVFVVRHESGEYKVVGRQCIGDFLGHASPESLLNAAEVLWSLEGLVTEAREEGWAYLRSGEFTFDITRYVATVSIWVRRFGWVPRSAKRDDAPATADEVWSFLLPSFDRESRRHKEELVRKHNLHVEEFDQELAVKALEWARSLDLQSGNDYLYNLRVACGVKDVTAKTSGLVASVVSAYKREVEKQELARRERETKRRGLVGVKGQRRGFPKLTVVTTRSLESMYGVKTLVIFETPEGDLLKWFASGDRTSEYETGAVYSITGTVKDHGEYKGVPDTQLSRVEKGIDPKKFDEAGEPRPKGTRRSKITTTE